MDSGRLEVLLFDPQLTFVQTWASSLVAIGDLHDLNHLSHRKCIGFADEFLLQNLNLSTVCDPFNHESVISLMTSVVSLAEHQSVIVINAYGRSIPLCSGIPSYN